MALELVMYRGDDRSWDFTLTEDSVAVNLTGKTIIFTGREDLDEDPATLVLTSAGGAIVPFADQPGAGKGKLTLTIPASATVDLDRGTTLLCDFEVTTTSDGTKRTWPEAVYGQSTLIRLRIKGDVTHP